MGKPCCIMQLFDIYIAIFFFVCYNANICQYYGKGIFMEAQIKTTSFGGYDKKAVESYIDELNAEHEKEVAELKANVLKLSETVKNLHTMREVNLNESSSAIDNLKKVNDEQSNEISALKAQLEDYRIKEQESASRYESISRTLLAARENADLLLAETNKQCDAIKLETQTECDRLMSEVTEECERLQIETTTSCDKMNAETQSACQELRETTYADCEDLKRKTREEVDELVAQTEYDCRTLSEQTQAECDDMKSQARIEAYNTRNSVKRECESISEYMSQLISAVNNVVKACDETKAVADQAFPDLSA